MSPSRRVLLAALLTAAAATAGHAQTPPAHVRLRATVMALDGDTLTLTSRGAQTVKATLTPQTVVTVVVPARLDDIKPGSFVGTAAVPGKNGTLVALEVHVFPEAMRGTGEGHRPFDLQPESTMTNGTVGDVVGTSGRTITVQYKGGQQTVTVPPDVPVVGFEPGDRAMLTPGAHVIVFGAGVATGTVTAARVLVGKNGLVPPM